MGIFLVREESQNSDVECKNNRIIENTLIENEGFGIYLMNCNYANLAENKLYGNGIIVDPTDTCPFHHQRYWQFSQGTYFIYMAKTSSSRKPLWSPVLFPIDSLRDKPNNMSNEESLFVIYYYHIGVVLPCIHLFILGGTLYGTDNHIQQTTL